MARRRSDGGVEECKGYSPPNDHTTSASSTPLPLDSWDLNAGTRSTETESFRSARVARRRATYAERTERQRLRDAHERRMAGGASPIIKTREFYLRYLFVNCSCYVILSTHVFILRTSLLPTAFVCALSVRRRTAVLL